MAGPASPSGARFVCRPSDNVELAFKTVRAQPRPANAQPEMETLLNVPVDELEEMLVVALQRARQFLDTCDPREGHAVIATRVEAESTARARDIQATSTLVYHLSGAHLNAFCREISVPGRQVRGDATDPDDVEVAAMLGKAGGGYWTPPPSVMQAVAVPATAAEWSAVGRARQKAKLAEEISREVLRFAFAEEMQVTSGGDTWEIEFGGLWTPQEPGTINLHARHPKPPPWRNESAATRLRREVAEIVQGLRHPRVAKELWADSLVPPSPCGVAARLKSAEQDWDAAGRFPAVSLTILQHNNELPTPGDPAGTLEAVLNPTLGMSFGYSSITPFKRPQLDLVQYPRLAASIKHVESFIFGGHAELQWRTVADKIAELRGLLDDCEDDALRREIAEAGEVEELVLKTYTNALLVPNGLEAAEAKVKEEFSALLRRGASSGAATPARGSGAAASQAQGGAGPMGPHGYRMVNGMCTCPNCVEARSWMERWKLAFAPVLNSAAEYSTRGLPLGEADTPARGGGRFVCVSTRKAAVAFETVRATPRAREAKPELETILNVPQDEVEEMLTVALERVRAAVSQPRTKGMVMNVVTRIDPECWSRSRDLRATSTLLYSSRLEGANAFCSMIDVEGRGLHAEPSAGMADCCFRLPLAADGRACGTFDVSTFVNADRYEVNESATKVTMATQVSHKRVLTCFRENVEVENPLGVTSVQVVGSFVESAPDIIFIGTPRQPVGASGGELLPRFEMDDTTDLDFFAKLIVRALRRPGALRAISAGALLGRMSEVDASAPAREQAWGAEGEFPAVSVNVILMKHFDHGTRLIPLVWLELPRGMRWRPRARNRASGLTQLAAEVADRRALAEHHSRSFGTTWDVVARATLDLQEMMRQQRASACSGGDGAPCNCPKHVVEEDFRAAQQAALKSVASFNGLDCLPFDRADEYRRFRTM